VNTPTNRDRTEYKCVPAGPSSFRHHQRWDDWRICRVKDIACVFAVEFFTVVEVHGLDLVEGSRTSPG
jgi:hypothetical protein